VTFYILIQNYFNKVSSFVYGHNFNSVCEGLFWVYYHTSLFLHAVQIGDCGTVCCDGVVYTADWGGVLSLFAVSQLHYTEQYCLSVCLSVCDARYCDTYVTTFRRNLLPPPSE
jgi:hypothetical protein